MLVLCLAIAIAGAGARLSLTGGTGRRAYARVVFHVGVVACLSLGLALAGRFAQGLTPWLMGAWFAGLAAVYAGHAIAVRHWGSPMSQAVFLFGLRKFPHFARTNPRLAMAVCPALVVLFGAGWAAARFDVPAGSTARLAVYLGGASVFLGCAAVAWRTARIGARSDLVLGLVLGGHGPMAGPPPDDPSLGWRWQHHAACAARRATVIFFVIDSLRSRNMSAFGYDRPTTPFLNSLLVHRGARAVPLAVSSCGSTETAYWSLFSSRRARHQAVNAPCLHDLLRAAGFTVRFLLSGTHRNWMGMQYLYGTDHDAFVDLLSDEQLVAEARKLPETPAAGGDFLFFHLMSPHAGSGYEPPPSWKPARNRSAYSETDDLDAAAREQIRNHYDNSVLQADDCVARIMEVLRQKGFLDNALVVVTGDHGEALGERIPVMIGHGRGLYQESIQVPLIVWDSTQALPEPVFLADQTDVAPTILAMLGIEAPSAWQGSFIWAQPGRRTAHVEHIAHRVGAPPTHMEALLALLPSGTFKIMRYREAGQEVLRKAFCLSADPDEKEDLNGRLAPDVEAELENALREYHEQPALASPTSWS
jgi:Sulfatase